MSEQDEAAPAGRGHGAAENGPVEESQVDAGKLAAPGGGDKLLVSRFKNVFARRGSKVTLESVIAEIQDGTHSEAVQKVRAIDDPEQQKSEKRQLPAFVPAGIRKSRRPLQFDPYSNVVVVDVDDLPSGAAEAIRDQAQDWPEVVAAFVSPSGRGVKVLWLHDGGVERHRVAWKLARDIMVAAGVPKARIDSNNDPGRDCFLSWDDEAFVRVPEADLRSSPTDATDATDDTDDTDDTENTDEGGGAPWASPADMTPPNPELAAALRKLQALTPEEGQRRELDLQAAHRELQQSGHIREFYGRYVRRIDPRQGTRNTSTVAAATFLFRAVSEEILRLLLVFYYRLNQTEFLDSIEEHERDIENILNGVRGSWIDGLNRHEQTVYGQLRGDEQVAFRILRDLGSQTGHFSMGQMHLAQRLSLDPRRDAAAAILRRFEDLGVIIKVKNGLPWSVSKERGLPRQATEFLWNHAMFRTEPSDSASGPDGGDP